MNSDAADVGGAKLGSLSSEELFFRELTEEEFSRLDFACGSFLQSVEMYRRYKALGREVYLVGVSRGLDDDETRGEIVAAGLVLARKWRFGKKIMRVPGGWLMDYDREDYGEILEFLTVKAQEFCRERGGIVIEISPNIVSQPRNNENRVIPEAVIKSTEAVAGGDGAVAGDAGVAGGTGAAGAAGGTGVAGGTGAVPANIEAMRKASSMARNREHLGVKKELVKLGYKYLGEYEQVKWTYVLELAGKRPERLLMKFRTTHRQLIKKAGREGVRVRELGDDELEILKRITAESGERHGFQEPEIEYYQSMKAAFSEKVKFVVAEIPVHEIREEDLREVEVVDGYVPLAASMFVDDGREIVYLYSGSIRRLQRYNGAYAIQWWAIKQTLKKDYARYNMYGVRPVDGDGVYRFKQGFRGHVEELLGTFALPVGRLGRLYLARLEEREFGEIR